MEIKIKLNKWNILNGKDQPLPMICGEFGIFNGAQEMAKQEFNDGYNSKKVIFPIELVQEIQGLEKKIVSHIENMGM